MTALSNNSPCQQHATKRDEPCKIRSGLAVGQIAVLSVAVVAFAILLCFRSSLKSRLDHINQVSNGARAPCSRIVTNPGQSMPVSAQKKTSAGKYPRVEKPGQYFDRVLGKWVDDIDLADETLADIMRVVNPDPGGIPRIPYDDSKCTDVTMPSDSKQQVLTFNSGARIMIPAHYATRRGLMHWSGQPLALYPMPITHPSAAQYPPRGSCLSASPAGPPSVAYWPESQPRQQPMVQNIQRVVIPPTHSQTYTTFVAVNQQK